MTEEATRCFGSPIGNIFMLARNNKIVFITMGGPAVPNFGSAMILDQAEKQLTQYFEGKTKVLDFEVEVEGTEFQRAVWAEIAKIPFGETKTYGEIAAAIGRPKAVRAVGGAVGANPVPLVIGCHRVLGSSGKITGYSGGDGLPTKRWLLALEGLKANE
ncbi:MAG: methylated-DNA--[protein]-cysteine S-methyltransferase [Rhodoluna sp.]